MKKLLRHISILMVWVLIVGYVIFASSLGERNRAAQSVEQLHVEIVDSTAQGNLITQRMAEGWIKKSGIKTVGVNIREVDLSGLERYIARNGFVKSVKAYTTLSGKLHVELSQHRPVLRLMLDGYNAYVTREGYVFNAPPTTSRYVQVVTGDYVPFFKSGYVGNIKDVLKAQLIENDSLTLSIEREKYPLYKRRQEIMEETLEVTRVYLSKGIFESHKKFDKRVAKLLKEKQEARSFYRYAKAYIGDKVELIERRRQLNVENRKKIEKKYEDFMKLIIFVENIENDSFWNSEIVQIVASQSKSSNLEVLFVPRSSEHLVVLGRLDDVEQKLGKLSTFYNEGLSRIGWDKYSVIDLRFDDQVVCR